MGTDLRGTPSRAGNGGMMPLRDMVVMVLSLGIILAAAEVFTNGVEWLGKKLNLGSGAVGSVLAAVGTALPETLVPIIAFLSFDGEELVADVGVGAILGAPFMLSTLAFFISGLAVLIFRRSNSGLYIQSSVIRRDMSFFLGAYTLAVLASLLPNPTWKLAIAALLPILYFVYVMITLRSSREVHELDNLSPLYLARRQGNPGLWLILGQLLLALLGMVAGAHRFVDAVQGYALSTGIPAFVLSLIITPIATELPEKFNSILWLKRGKDTLALGNITGAMVFQSSVIPAIGISMTTWKLDGLALWSALLALLSSFLLLTVLSRQGTLRPSNLMMGGIFYLAFILTLLAGLA